MELILLGTCGGNDDAEPFAHAGGGSTFVCVRGDIHVQGLGFKVYTRLAFRV